MPMVKVKVGDMAVRYGCPCLPNFVFDLERRLVPLEGLLESVIGKAHNEEFDMKFKSSN